MEWVSIRGPIGAPRQDFYVTTLSMLIARLIPGLRDINAEDYMMPWLKPDEVNVAQFIMPWIDTRGTAPNEEK